MSSTESSSSSSFHERQDSPPHRSRSRSYPRMRPLPSPTPTTPPPDKPDACPETAASPTSSSTSPSTRPSPRSLLLPVPPPLLPVLHLFAQTRHGDGAGSEAEILEFGVSPWEYDLLWALLGLGQESQRQRDRDRDHDHDTTGDEVEAWPSCVLPYLPALRAEGLPASAEELSDLGRWVLDSVRYDFFSEVDVTGATSTRLWIRMPTIIHDQTANDVAQLLRDAIRPAVGGQRVTACSMKCEFSDRFQRMLAEQRQTEHPANTRLQARSAEARLRRQALRTEGRSGHRGVAVVPGPSTFEDTAGTRREWEQEQERYEEAQPDVCIFAGSMAQDLFPALIVEVGFSHPLPFDRARSFIYGSEGRCRVVICLDIEYREKEKRLQSYQAMDEQQRAQRQVPPYGITLNLFRCNIEAAGQHDTYTAKHELRNVDVREAAQLEKTLKLRRDDIIHVDDEDEGQDMCSAEVTISYADLVKIVDEAAWSMAVREQPLLQQQRKRKRLLMAKLPSVSPEPEASGNVCRPKKRKQR